MPRVLELKGDHVELLQGGDGGAFRDFLKGLLRAHVLAFGGQAAGVVADHRNVADGGVDAEVAQAFPSDPLQYCATATCWQFKAQAKGDVTAGPLRKEVKKPYVQDCLKRGHAYRVCIADNLTPQDVNERVQALREEIRAIHPDAPEPLVLGATALAEWASRYPSFVHSFRQHPPLWNLEQWRESAVGETREYVPIESWRVVAEAVRAHVDLSQKPPSALTRVRGEAGVGKTRFVFETLVAIPGMESLCLYTMEESVGAEFTAQCAGDPDAVAVLVLDECLPVTQQKLRRLLRGKEHRLRVIAIDNTSEMALLGEPEPKLSRMSKESVEQVLERNFPELSADDRRVAIALSEGYIKIATDFCLNGLSGGYTGLQKYLETRFPETEDRDCISLLSFAEQVGWKDEVRGELAELAKWLGKAPQEVLDRARRIKDETGFVTEGGRYLYVTPAAVARVAFQRGWRKWAEQDALGFLGGVPVALLEKVSRRVRDFGTNDARDALSAVYGQELAALTPADLADKKKVERAVALVEANPERHLADLAAVIRSASREELLRNEGSWHEGWGPRRRLVWLCERLAIFPELFHEAEEILFRLALAESEPSIGNNATAIWRQLYQPFLSGTTIPMMERLAILEARLADVNGSSCELILSALGEVFQSQFGRSGSPPLISGRVPPRDWQPATVQEIRAYVQRALELLERAAGGDEATATQQVCAFVIRIARTVLSYGHAKWLQHFVKGHPWFQAHLGLLLEALDDFLRYEGAEEPHSPEYLEEIRNWRASLLPRDFKSRLELALTRERWLGVDAEEEHERMREIRALAAEAVQNPVSLATALEVVKRPDAVGAFDFGEALAGADQKFSCWPELLRFLQEEGFTMLRGYARAMAETSSEGAGAVRSLLEALLPAKPREAYMLILTAAEKLPAFRYTMELLEGGGIPAQALQRFPAGVLESAELVDLLEWLAAAAERDKSAPEAAITLLHGWLLERNVLKKPEPVPPKLITAAAKILEISQPRGGHLLYQWSQLLKWLAASKPDLAIKLAIRALTERAAVGHRSSDLLQHLASGYPRLFMDRLGDALLDQRTGLLLGVVGIESLLCAVPESEVLRWIEEHGVEAARAIASSLPRPFVDDVGGAIVPKLTEQILDRWGEDEKVVRRFVVESGIKTYGGDIAGQHEAEADTAKRFLNHRLRAVREWARIAKASAEKSAQEHRQELAERVHAA